MLFAEERDRVEYSLVVVLGENSGRYVVEGLGLHDGVAFQVEPSMYRCYSEGFLQPVERPFLVLFPFKLSFFLREHRH